MINYQPQLVNAGFLPSTVFLAVTSSRTTNPNVIDVQVPAAGWTQWFLFIGLIEKGLYTYDPTRSPGDYKNAGAGGWVVALWCFLLEVILKKAFEKSFFFFTIKRSGGRCAGD